MLFFYFNVFLDTSASEIANTKWRTEAAIWAYTASGIAHTIFPGLAYICKDWRKLQFVIGFFHLPFLFLYFFLPESPRYVMQFDSFN